MDIFDFLNMAGGLAMFLYGMNTMGGGLSKMAGGKLEGILERLTSKKIFAVLLGAGVTAIIQSSSATTVMVVGAILTAIIQSSSASIGILQALCLSGAVPFAVAIPIIMGQNIGTCVTSIISSIGATKNAKRAAMIHLYFNLIGTIIFMAIFYAAHSFMNFEFLDAPATVAEIAIVHSMFNIGATLILYPFSNMLVKLAEITIKDQPEQELVEKADELAVSIDERFLERPAFAMEICRGKVREMAEYTQKSIISAMELVNAYDKSKYEEVIRLEKLVDEYEDALGSYLVKLSGKNLSTEDNKSLSIILHSLSDFERVSDHAHSIALSTNEIHSKNLSFSDEARKEMSTITAAVTEICTKTTHSFCNENIDEALSIEPLEEVIDVLTKMIKERHIKRLQAGKCSIEMGFILEDMLNSLERVSDHCSNIALEMITIFDNEYNTHEYYKSMSDEERDRFNEDYKAFVTRYSL